MINVIIVGANGRMGKNLLSLIAQNANFNLVGAISSSLAGQLINQHLDLAYPKFADLKFSSDLNQISGADLIIDFSNHAITEQLLGYACRHKIALVLGTTGHTAQQLQLINQASSQIAICMAANFSVGVNLLLGLVAQAAQILHTTSDIEISEAHHRYKLDAPSGTALALAKSITTQLGWDDSALKLDRTAQQQPRSQQEIGFAVTRAGEIIGEHSVIFANGLETIKLEHVANDRKVFAQGALDAGVWLLDKPAKLYSMQQVLGLKD